MKKVFLIIIFSFNFSHGQQICHSSTKSALLNFFKDQPQLSKYPNYNYQDIQLRVEKRTQIEELYNVWYSPKCQVRNPASTGHKKFRKKRLKMIKKKEIKKGVKKDSAQVFLSAGIGINNYKADFDANNYKAKLVSRPSLRAAIHGFMVVSNRNRLVFNVDYRSYSFKQATNKDFKNKDISTLSYDLGLTHHTSRRTYFYGSLGLKEFIMNKAETLNTLTLYSDIAPEVKFGVNYKFYKYKRFVSEVGGAGAYYFRGMQGDFENGTSVSVRSKSSYYIKKSKISLEINIKKNLINGVFYRADELENDFTLFFGQNF